MSISKMIVAAFEQAALAHPDLEKSWIRVSVRLGSALPSSDLMSSVQRDGSLDLVLRCMEDERAQAPEPAGWPEIPHQRRLSELWIGGVYETLRLLTDTKRKLMVVTDEARALAEDFRLVRVSLEKHEIPGDYKLKAPLQMQRQPPQNDHTDLYVYDKADPKRAHIMPTGPSDRGSVTWFVVDLDDHDRWIERRALSDRTIALWG